MKELLNFIVSKIVDKPEAIKIEQTTDKHGTIRLILEVDKDDIGKVIGKQGKIIKAIRSLLRVKAIKTQQRVFLDLKEDIVKQT